MINGNLEDISKFWFILNSVSLPVLIRFGMCVCGGVLVGVCYVAKLFYIKYLPVCHIQQGTSICRAESQIEIRIKNLGYGQKYYLWLIDYEMVVLTSPLPHTPSIFLFVVSHQNWNLGEGEDSCFWCLSGRWHHITCFSTYYHMCCLLLFSLAGGSNPVGLYFLTLSLSNLNWYKHEHIRNTWCGVIE